MCSARSSASSRIWRSDETGSGMRRPGGKPDEGSGIVYDGFAERPTVPGAPGGNPTCGAPGNPAGGCPAKAPGGGKGEGCGEPGNPCGAPGIAPGCVGSVGIAPG